MSPIDRAQIISKLITQKAALDAQIKLLRFYENEIDVSEIINLQINISNTLDLLLNPIEP